MPQFSDSQGDVWTVAITLNKARRIARSAGIDILNAEQGESIVTSLGVQLELLWHLTSDERAMRDVRTLDQFEDRVSGESVNYAVDALLEAIALFFQRMGQKSQTEAWSKAKSDLREAKGIVIETVSTHGSE